VSDVLFGVGRDGDARHLAWSEAMVVPDVLIRTGRGRQCQTSCLSGGAGGGARRPAWSEAGAAVSDVLLGAGRTAAVSDVLLGLDRAGGGARRPAWSEAMAASDIQLGAG
jgi:hypothetical protein